MLTMNSSPQEDPWLQETTASEPLTLQEEYEMQKEWAEDPKSKFVSNYISFYVPTHLFTCKTQPRIASVAVHR